MPKKVTKELTKKGTRSPKKPVAEQPNLKGVGEQLWGGVKDIGNGLLMLLKVIFNFVVWIFGGSIVLVIVIDMMWDFVCFIATELGWLIVGRKQRLVGKDKDV